MELPIEPQLRNTSCVQHVLPTAIVLRTRSLSTSQPVHRLLRLLKISLHRHSRSYAMLRTSIVRATGSSLRQAARPQASPAALVSVSNAQQTRQAHAISNPTLANIEKRWEAMPPQEQAELWMALRDRMKVDWNELTMQEKKAGTLISLQYWLCFVLVLGAIGRTSGRMAGVLARRTVQSCCAN